VRTIGKRTATVAMLLSFSAARADDVTIPVIGQPTPFYGAAGTGVTVEAAADRTELTPTDSIVLTLRIRRLINAADVQRPDLSAIEAFSKDFQIEDVDATEPQPEGTQVFHYRLRPRRATVATIPAISFPYYDPSRSQPPDRPDFPFLTVRTNPITIRVRKADPPVLPIVPLDVPIFATAPAESSPVDLPTWVWWLAALGPPIIAIAWCVFWIIMNPAGARLARRRRSRAARTALHRLRALGRHQPADLEAIVECVEAYLAEHFGLPVVLRTPDELAKRLNEAGANADTVAQCVAFLRFADTARFAPGPKVTGEILIAEAEALIRQQEGEA
jgi:BatD DUF11 like domain